MERAPIGALSMSLAYTHWPAFTPPRWPGIRPALTALLERNPAQSRVTERNGESSVNQVGVSNANGKLVGSGWARHEGIDGVREEVACDFTPGALDERPGHGGQLFPRPPPVVHGDGIGALWRVDPHDAVFTD